jgi:methionine-gamma-lyase
MSAGAHMVSTASVYGPSRGLMEKQFSRFGVESTYVDTSNLTQVREAVRAHTKLVYLETPANPTMQLTDIK